MMLLLCSISSEQRVRPLHPTTPSTASLFRQKTTNQATSHYSSGLKYTTTSAVLVSLYRDQHFYLISTTSDRGISYQVLPGFISQVWWVM